jgi:hypothetical protein
MVPVEPPTDPMQDRVDRDWQLLIKGEELLDKAHAVARKIEKRIRTLPLVGHIH